ncbi:MAG: radical SAM protein [bacterium]|nr:radical SAM protein [bacterium]
MKKRPLLFDWAITKECNLNCLHCRGMTRAELPKSLILKVAHELVELKPEWVIIEGGEPLTRKGIWEVFSILTTGGLDVSMITNGTLLTEENMVKLLKLGVGIQISIDSPYPEIYEKLRRGAKFQQVTETAKQLSKTGKLHAINFVLSKDNYKSIPDMFKLAKDINAGLINIIGLKPTKSYKTKLLSSAEYKEAILMTTESSGKYGVDFFFDEPFFKAACKEWGVGQKDTGKKSRIVVSEKNGCVFGEYLFMEPNGDLKPCTFANYVVGNAKEGILNVWESLLNSEFILNINKKTNRKGVCLECKHLDICGGCRSRAYALTDDWLESDIVCPIKDLLK